MIPPEVTTSTGASLPSPWQASASAARALAPNSSQDSLRPSELPADAQPIILFVEQTVGGYAKIATVISVDLFRVAQATPGDTIRFEAVDLDRAHALYRERQALVAQIAACLE